MPTRRQLLNRGLSGLALLASMRAVSGAQAAPNLVSRTDAEWRKRLTAEQYRVLRQEGTETPFTSPLLDEKRHGVFACAACNLPLFSSETKYESHTGWPSFWAPLDGGVTTRDDTTLGMTRTEVECARCAGHLGHVFNDGPPPTGLRYCMNGVAMTFVPKAA